MNCSCGDDIDAKECKYLYLLFNEKLPAEEKYNIYSGTCSKEAIFFVGFVVQQMNNTNCDKSIIMVICIDSNKC